MIHLMLGHSNDKAVCDLTEYVHRYEVKDALGSFIGMLGIVDKDGNLIFKTAQRVVKSDDPLRFNSEPDDAVTIQLEETAVIDKKDQNEYLKNFFSRLYDKTININTRNRENVLNVCIHLPLYDKDSWALTKTITQAIVEQTRNIRVDFFFYAPDMAFIFVPKEQQENLPKLQIGFQVTGKSVLNDALNYRKEILESGKFGHIVVMQNCNAEGISLDLEWDSFIRIIGEFAIATMNSYLSIFNPNAEIDDRPIHSFGLCVLNLDKYYYVRYLLSRAYLTILEREGVDQENVDVSIPSHIIQKAMVDDNNRYKFYDRFYERRAKGYLVDGKTESEINAMAQQDIDGDIASLIDSLTAFINNPELSLPQKRITLAQLLGMDDEMATGDMFDPEQLIFRDTYKDCMRMFVSANNALLKESPTGLYVDIPESDFKREDYPEDLGLKTKAALGEKEIDFDTLCSSLKSNEVKIRRQTEYVRTLEKELERCEVQTKQVLQKEKVLTEEGFRIGDHVFKLDPIETILLEDTYQPKSGPLPKSVDLRKAFSGIRSQGGIGACTTFTMASIYEYILRKNQQKDVDLSERFIYYNARIAAQKRRGEEGQPLEDKGTSFFDVIGTMGSEGICLEKLCEYSTDETINERPSEEAYLDAKSRLVTVAKNVNLEEGDIKSALDEGYPVAVSVKLFSNFVDNHGGFVSLPDEEEVKAAKVDADYEHNHAMVICGYSDENRVFVVRNSWGADFGDKGYCYMPYSYITDNFLTNQACVITEVSHFSATQVKGVSTREIVQFDKLNPEINAAIMKILIGEAKSEKNRLIKGRTDLYEQYILIEKKLVSAESRESLFNGTSDRLDWELKEVARQKEANYESQNERIASAFNAIKRSCIIHSIAVAIVIALWILLHYIKQKLAELSPLIKEFMDYMGDHSFSLPKVCLTILGIIVISVIICIIRYLKKKKAILKEHANVNEELETIEHALTNGAGENSGNLGLYKSALGIRMFLPWLVIRKLSEKNRELEQKYQTMVSYTRNLKEWYKTEKAKISEMNPDTKEPFISLVSNSTLDTFYARHAEAITSDLRLSTLFQAGYSMDEASIIKFQNELKNKIIAALEDGLKDFTAYRYISGNSKFEYAKEMEGDVHDMLHSLETKSSVFLRMDAAPVTHESINATTTILMSKDILDDLPTWRNNFEKDFTSTVTHMRIETPFKLSFIQMKRIPLSECLDLK